MCSAGVRRFRPSATRATFGAKNLEQDLSRLLRDATIEQHRNVLDRPLAKSALAGEGRPVQLLPV